MTRRQNTKSIPATRCYWALLDTPPKPATLDSLRFTVEPLLPAPIDTINCRFVQPHAKGRILACGLDAGAKEFAEDPGVSLRPDTLPEFVSEALQSTDFDAEALLGRLAFPSRGRDASSLRARPSRVMMVFLVLSLSAGLLCMTMLQRASAFQDLTHQFEQAISNVVTDTLGPAHGAEMSLPPRTRLEAESRRLARTRSGDDGSDPGSADITPDLVALLAIWPEDIPTRVEQIDLRGGILTVRGSVRDTADFEQLKIALADGLEHYEPPTGSASRAREGFNFDLAMRTTLVPPRKALAERDAP